MAKPHNRRRTPNRLFAARSAGVPVPVPGAATPGPVGEPPGRGEEEARMSSGALSTGQAQDTVRTNVPARLDPLPWTRWHWIIVIGLGTVWILDGLEVTIVGNLSGQLAKPGSGIDITQSQVTGFGAASYVLGACVGALFFGWLTDRFGRKKLFLITLMVYLLATAATALSVTSWMFFLFRFLTGFGIGGEYAAINSAIDELIPKQHRGRIDIVINGTYW